MEDPAVVAGRVTATAKDLADQARVLAAQAITESADDDTYTAGQFIDTFTKSADLAIKGGLQLTRDVFDQPGPPDPNAKGRKQVADVMETIGRRMIRQAGAVARDTATTLDKDPNTPSVWVRSMVKLANISLLGSIELAETALIGPAKGEKRLTLSDDFPAAGSGKRLVRVNDPGLARPGTSNPIPDEDISFHKAEGKGKAELEFGQLGGKASGFRIGVDPRHLISGIYVGTVDVLDAKTFAVIDTVAVEIAI